MKPGPRRASKSVWFAGVALVVLLAVLVFHAGAVWGRAHDCAPNQVDGQCGLASALGEVYGGIGAGAVLAIGATLLILLRPRIRLRRSARVFLFDERGDILLIRFVAQRTDGPFVCWVTPGGEVEEGEADLAAAERELAEELGVRPPLVGPVHEESGGTYEHLGETVRNYDVFFAAQCGRDLPRLAGVTEDEIALMQEARWWTLEELKSTAENIFPVEIARLAVKAYARSEERG